MIVFDTETTGFISSMNAPIHTQPKIIEIFALKIDDKTLKEISTLSLLIDPGESISEEITGITSITNDMVRGVGQFPVHLKAIQDFWLGERAMVAHNLSFDSDMLMIELKRIGAEAKFPWPPTRFCTVELSEHYEGRRMKLIDLHNYLFGVGFEKAHRAEPDVRACHRCLVEIHNRGDLPVF